MAPLIIQTTGLEDYAPGGKARVKVMVIGGPGTGKTRWSSYFPQPMYADCEGGLASVADRKVPYVRISSSQDMHDVLGYLKQECKQPAANRKYQTFVVDTLDAYQRKVKDEWMLKENKQTFTGWEAWGYLNSRMQVLMTRLLNLDMNVIVLVHYKEKTVKDDDSGTDVRTFTLQVQGDLADTAFNDFDLVAWMGTYWEAVDGERTRKRGLTFKATPGKPFLKDRLNVTPPWLEVEFADTDYTNLFDAIQSRVEDIAPGEVVGEVPADVGDRPTSGFVVPPGGAGSGPLAGRAVAVSAQVTYAQMDKPTLTKLARERGIFTIQDGTPIRGNTLKAELVGALEAHDAAPAAAPATAPAPAGRVTSGESAVPAAKPAVTPTANPARTQIPGTTRATEAGTVDVTTGEILDVAETPSMEQAIATAHDVLGAKVIAQGSAPASPPTAPSAPAPGAPDAICDVCGESLAEENSDLVKLAWIKFRKKLCAKDYALLKAAR